MTKKERLIQAFKSLDFKALENLLDDNKSYMDVPKKLFLKTLKKEIESHNDLKSFDSVAEGSCGTCNKGCKAYKFKTGTLSLKLFFEGNENDVTDIYLCHDLIVNNPNDDEYDIYFNFYEEEKVNFSPTITYSINLQKIEKAIKEFVSFESRGLVSIDEVAHWFNKLKTLAEDINLNDPFVTKKYKAYNKINSLYSKVSELIHNYNNNHLAKIALENYEKISNKEEKEIIRWLLANKDNYFFSLKKTDNWENTGFIVLETEPNLVIDCSEYLDSFIFDRIYYNHWNKIMEKYEPTKEHFEQHGGRVICTLESYLRLHDKHLDLLDDDSMPNESSVENYN